MKKLIQTAITGFGLATGATGLSDNDGFSDNPGTVANGAGSEAVIILSPGEL